MVALPTDVVSLARIKRECGVPDQLTTEDERLGEILAEAVGQVGSENGIPLIDKDDFFDLKPWDRAPYMRVDLPLGWVIRKAPDMLTWVDPKSNLRRSFDADPSIAPINAGLNYLVTPQHFKTNDWPPGMLYPQVAISVGLEQVPLRLRQAVIVTARAMYRGEERPREVANDLLQ